MVSRKMLTVKGTYRDGNIQLEESVNYSESKVLVIFLDDDDTPAQSQPDDDWSDFNNLIANCQMETGIPDLAHQHDHYQHGSPKRELD